MTRRRANEIGTASNSTEKKGSPSRSEAFPLFGIKPNIKAKQFSIPFKKNLAGGR